MKGTEKINEMVGKERNKTLRKHQQAANEWMYAYLSRHTDAW